MGTVASVLLSFAVATLSGMGVGGGGLFVIFLALLTDLPQQTVQGMNLLFFLVASGCAVTVHISRRRILWHWVLLMVLFGIIGALGGAYLSSVIGQKLLRKGFGVFLVITGILSLRQQKKKP